jgi:hypothetical protein
MGFREQFLCSTHCIYACGRQTGNACQFAAASMSCALAVRASALAHPDVLNTVRRIYFFAVSCLQGKTFQCALAFKKLGISPIVMSAGELESGNAGEPAKLIRQRYRCGAGCCFAASVSCAIGLVIALACA